MKSEELQILLSKTRNAVIAINRPGRSPHATPVWFLWDGESFFITTVTTSVKYALLKQNPDVTLVIDDDVEMHQYAIAYGRAEIIDQNVQQLADQLRDKYVPPELREEWTKILFSPHRIIIKLHPDKLLTGPDLG